MGKGVIDSNIRGSGTSSVVGYNALRYFGKELLDWDRDDMVVWETYEPTTTHEVINIALKDESGDWNLHYCEPMWGRNRDSIQQPGTDFIRPAMESEYRDGTALDRTTTRK